MMLETDNGEDCKEDHSTQTDRQSDFWPVGILELERGIWRVRVSAEFFKRLSVR